MPIDLKKEIKLSDLVPRRRKAAEGEAPKEAQSSKPARATGKGSGLKKEIKLSDLVPRRRKAAADAASKEEKPPKAARGRPSLPFRRGPGKPKAGDAPAAAPAVAPSVPLMRAFNLMPKDEPRQGRGSPAPLPQIGLAVLGLLLVVGLGAAYLLIGAGVADKQSRADDLRAQVAAQQDPSPAPQAPAQAPTDPALLQESQVRTAALADALAGRVAWDRVLREFSLVLPDDVSLTTLTAGSQTTDDSSTPPEGAPSGSASFTITGLARSQEDVALLLSRLAVLPEFDTVQLQTSVREEDAYNFSIIATVAAQGAAS